MKFYVGLHEPSHAEHFQTVCVSINRLRNRKKHMVSRDVIVDSGAFTELSTHGAYRHSVAQYAAELRRLHENNVVRITIAVAQDYMCEPFMLAKTGMTVAEHQKLTIERYDALLAEKPPCPIMPVLQGFAPQEYVDHLRAYGSRLEQGAWVGVGSVCKRNTDPKAILEVLKAIKSERPDLRLHGFGVKYTALADFRVQDLLFSADSMAWSLAARKQGRDQHDWREAKVFADRIEDLIEMNED